MPRKKKPQESLLIKGRRGPKGGKGARSLGQQQRRFREQMLALEGAETVNLISTTGALGYLTYAEKALAKKVETKTARVEEKVIYLCVLLALDDMQQKEVA